MSEKLTLGEGGELQVRCGSMSYEVGTQGACCEVPGMVPAERE